MIICFSCSAQTKQQLDSLLATQQYEGYAAAIASAVANLVAIQEELGNEGHLVIGTSSEEEPRHPSSSEGTQSRAETSAQAAPPRSPSAEATAGRTRLRQTIPTFFSLDRFRDTPPADLAPAPTPSWAAGETVPLHHWTFGQYNRLLPVKATCRGLARLLLDEPQGVSVQDAPHRLASEATKLGDYLAAFDSAHGRTRDDKLATAFPTTAKNVVKSQTRFANQFVVTPGRSGLSGLPVGLHLINHASHSKDHLQLTDAGWRFALLKSPVLDQELSSAADRFSTQETAFLLHHIARSVPAEDFAYRAVLRAILDGGSTPTTLDSVLREHIPAHDSERLTSGFLTSQRSGAISRMTDLGLVQRRRIGVRVLYKVTPDGRRYLAGEYN